MNNRPMAILHKPHKVQLLINKRIKEKIEELLNILMANKNATDDRYSKLVPILKEILVT
jgi:hypothetical protein